MAEGFLRKYAGDSFDVFSAGLEPRPVHPMAIQEMNEIGIDISNQVSKDLDSVLGKQSFKHAIFVCHHAEENCPRIYPFALEELSWPFEDPAAFDGNNEDRLNKFREIRDHIDKKIQEWLDSLTADEEHA
jgi:arsenate reductase